MLPSETQMLIYWNSQEICQQSLPFEGQALELLSKILFYKMKNWDMKDKNRSQTLLSSVIERKHTVVLRVLHIQCFQEAKRRETSNARSQVEL